MIRTPRYALLRFKFRFHVLVLISNDTFSQEPLEGDNPAEIEVTLISSDSEPPPQKIRRTVRKYQFSHPYAKLDPNFDLKKQQHEALRRTTRHSGLAVESSGISLTPARKRRAEVMLSPTLLHPKAGLIRKPLKPTDPDYQETPLSSSGESTATQLPPLKTAPG